jgi:hypothetical protein
LYRYVSGFRNRQGLWTLGTLLVGWGDQLVNTGISRYSYYKLFKKTLYSSVHLSTSKIIFFLGAGASVDAGLPGVVGLVNEIWNSSKDKKNKDLSPKLLAIVKKILYVLKRWKTERNDKTPLDVEILLEAIEKIENLSEDVLSAFYDNKNLKIKRHAFSTNDQLSTQIKRLIRNRFSDTRVKTDYLEPLQDFIIEHKPLSVFSTNYDVCIEQFCKNSGVKPVVDGFDPNWNPEREYKRVDDVKLQLYKLHGSITWYMSEEGDYTRSDIIIKHDRPIFIGGKQTVPLILYPGSKLKYIEPVIYMLFELGRQLDEVQYVFVIGYSFKDEHLARIFQYAAERNRKFVVFLVSPNAYEVYDQKLRCHKDEQFPKRFRRSYTPKPLPSQLNGRVICLNYKFEKVFPLLKNNYLKPLIAAQEQNNKIKYMEMDGNFETWMTCLRNYIDCEYIERADKIIQELGWKKILSKDWLSSFEISYKGLLTSLLYDEESLKSTWKDYFAQVTSGFSIEKFVFQPSISPPYVGLAFQSAGGNVTPGMLAQRLTDMLIPIAERKLDILCEEHEPITRLVDKLKLLSQYLRLWGETMTYAKYYDMRGSEFPRVIDELKRKVIAYGTKQNEDGQRPVKELIRQIETKVLRRIYDGPALVA